MKSHAPGYTLFVYIRGLLFFLVDFFNQLNLVLLDDVVKFDKEYQNSIWELVLKKSTKWWFCVKTP